MSRCWKKTGTKNFKIKNTKRQNKIKRNTIQPNNQSSERNNDKLIKSPKASKPINQSIDHFTTETKEKNWKRVLPFLQMFQGSDNHLDVGGMTAGAGGLGSRGGGGLLDGWAFDGGCVLGRGLLCWLEFTGWCGFGRSSHDGRTSGLRRHCRELLWGWKENVEIRQNGQWTRKNSTTELRRFSDFKEWD